MLTELFPLQLAFRGLSDEDDEDPTVVDAPGDLDDDDADEDDDDAAVGNDDADDTAAPIE
ncbi:MAG TPA: hypothetical protein VIJ29_03970 [Candidatus Paceibacterota bacterium]